MCFLQSLTRCKMSKRLPSSNYIAKGKVVVILISQVGFSFSCLQPCWFNSHRIHTASTVVKLIYQENRSSNNLPVAVVVV